MADAGHKATDKLLKKLEKDIAAEYKIAVNDMEAKLTAYLEKTEAQRKVQEGMLNAGKITQKEYSDWCYRHNMVGNRWIAMCDTLAEDMTHANEIAKGIMEQRMPDVFALNANYATWQIESQGIDTGFTLYNHDTAAYLLGDQRQLMPKPSPRKAALIAANPDMQWNKQKIQSAVLQGVLQGESASEVAQRLQQVGQMNYNSAVRYARTMTTSAQNAGRYEAYRRAKRLGVDLTIEWEAILDHHTRHAHRQMHGQQTEVDKPFYTPDGYTIYYPADCTGASTAPQKEIWNCRCTLLSWVKGYEGDSVTESPALKDSNMSFFEWQNAKKTNFTKQNKNAIIGQVAASPSPFSLTLGTQYTVSDLTHTVYKNFPFSDGTTYGVRKQADADVYTLPNGLEIVYPKSYNKQNQTLTKEQLLEAYNRVPEEIRNKGQKRIIVNDVYNPQDSYWKKVYKNFSRSYATGGDTINFWRDNHHTVDYIAVETLPHEMAHFIDWQGKYPTGNRISNGQDWTNAMQLDLSVSGMSSPTQYGRNSNTEDFAESFTELVKDAAKFEKMFPNRFGIIKGILKP